MLIQVPRGVLACLAILTTGFVGTCFGQYGRGGDSITPQPIRPPSFNNQNLIHQMNQLKFQQQMQFYNTARNLLNQRPVLPAPNYNRNYIQRPQYNRSQSNRSQPSRNYVQKTQPKRNTVVTGQVPKTNVNPLQNTKRTSHAQQVTDSEILRGADDLAKNIDQNLFPFVNNGSTSPDKTQAMNDWKQMISTSPMGPTPQQIDQFLRAHGSVISPSELAMIEYRKNLAILQHGMRSGTLWPQQRTDLLNQLSWQATNMGNQSDMMRLQYMGNVNLLGQLSQNIPPSANYFDVLLHGVHNAGLPIYLVGDMTGVPVYDIQPISDAPATSSNDSHRKCLLWNPKSNDETINYQINGSSYSLKAGFQQPIGSSQTVSFDNGQGKTVRQNVSDGIYQFQWNGDTWSFIRFKAKVVIDNSDYAGEFHYTVDNKHATLAAGEKVEHASDQPIEISFDCGDGTTARKVIKSGHYLVGVEDINKRLDLFKAESVEARRAETSIDDEPVSRRSSSVTAPKQQRMEQLLEQLKAKPGTGTRPIKRPVSQPLFQPPAGTNRSVFYLPSEQQGDAPTEKDAPIATSSGSRIVFGEVAP